MRRLWADPAWAGVRFLLAGRDAQCLAPLMEEALSGGHPAQAVLADLNDPSQVQALAQTASAERLLGFAFVAGINHDDPITRLSEADWDRQWSVNAGAHARLLESLPWAEGARGLLIGSQVALRGNAGQAAYAASKGQLERLLYTAPVGLRLNLLLPPLVDSPLLANLSPEARERLFKARLLPDPDPAGTCAAAAAFLLSDDARYIHRTTWHADSRVSVLGMDY